MRLLLAVLTTTTLLLAGCCPPVVGYRTSSVAEAILTTTQAVVAYPEMVVPRNAVQQKQMEDSADHRGPMVVPEGVLGPDLFIQDTALAPAQYANQAPGRR